MTNRSTNPVILFDYEPESSIAIEYIWHQQRTHGQGNEDIIGDKIPKLREEASPYEILQFLSAFQRVHRTMNWTTGPKLHQKFPVHLSDYHLDVWELLTNEQNATVANFNEQLQEFKAELLLSGTCKDQTDCLWSLKKTGKMQPSQFLLKLKAANRMATRLTDAPEFENGLSELQLRRVFLAAMPRTWQEHFENANLSVHNTTIQEIRTYMDKRSAKNPVVPKNKREN